MNTTTTTKSFPVSSVDLIAALRHDYRIAKSEGFAGVAERAAAALEFLEQAIHEFHDDGSTETLTVEITVTATA